MRVVKDSEGKKTVKAEGRNGKIEHSERRAGLKTPPLSTSLVFESPTMHQGPSLSHL